VEEALSAATTGDMAPFARMMAVLADPFRVQSGAEDLTTPAPAGSAPHVTFCGT